MKLAYILLIIVVLIVSIAGITFTGQLAGNSENTETKNQDDIRAEIEPERVGLEEVQACPEECDDEDPCTEDYCNEETDYKCVYIGIDSPECICGECDDFDDCTMDFCNKDTGNCEYASKETCCGNGNCDNGETFDSCSKDCLDCTDYDSCTTDSYSYEYEQCMHEDAETCCGNNECEETEDNSNCPEDCEQQEGESSVFDILINEILINPSEGAEWLELYNPTAYDIDISGTWIDDIIDGGRNPQQIKENSIVPNHGFLVIEITKYNTSYFNNDKDDVNFIDADGTTIIDSYSYIFGSSIEKDYSLYRLPNGGEWQSEPTDNPTKGSSNV